MLRRSTSSRYTLSIIVLLAAGLMLAGCGGGGSSSSKALEGPEDAVAIYKQRCMQCHGNEMQGLMGAPSNLQKVGERLSKEDIVNTIKNGGERMPALGKSLDEADIEKVAEWLASKK
ncbi:MULTISPECIES: c-type cytochrome [unclassified Paenibacillus]|uniref:c-type cytochrome n=1 Tax=unclassified Paenibacillus TaxID=185978 RepID=UPI000378880F|nr:MULTISPECIES: cytochrome c [unclassified Paenibacillus]MCM3342819.1 cytochrome c [Paenibacillus sp. MER TA 81-3]